MNCKKGKKKFIIRILTLSAALMGLFGLQATAAMEDRFDRIGVMSESGSGGIGLNGRFPAIRAALLVPEIGSAKGLVFADETETESESEEESESESETESERPSEAEAVPETEGRMTELPAEEPMSETLPETEAQSEAKTEAATETGTAPQAETAQTEGWTTELPVTELPAEETIPETLPETEAQSEAQTEAAAETETAPQAETAQTEGRTAELPVTELPTEEKIPETEMEEIPDVAFTIPEDLERTLAELTGIEMETETESETESETEEEPDERELIAEAMLEDVQLGSDFRIPMRMPEELGTMPEYAFYHCGKLPFERRDSGSFPDDRTIGDLEAAVKNAIWGYEGTWSVYVKNLNTDESFLINDTPMKSASVMKLFIMGTVYTAMTDGELERTDTIVSLLNQMITFSSNEASNELLSILGNGSYAEGIAKVNTFIREHGYSEMTFEYNGFSNPATNTGGGTNQVSAADVGQLLEDIYRRTWLTRAQSNEVEAMMLAQDTRYKIPAGLPDGVLCANKTGEMSGTENDAAIIYSDACDYILVILSSDWGSSDLAVSRIGNLSALVYDFFNN